MRRNLSVLFFAVTVISCVCLQSCGEINPFDIDDINEFISQDVDFSAEEIYEIVSPSVVEITGETRTGVNTGTGFFYNEKGLVVTNYHVIEDCISAQITLLDGSNYMVEKVMGYDVFRDIAILSTTCEYSVPLKTRVTTVQTGETVYAIGSSLGLSGSFSNGIVSAGERSVNGYSYIQTTVPVSHGNSGGPLVDKEGNVIGIITASFDEGQNLNLAIPIMDIYSLNTRNPVSLSELFPQMVEWISERDFFYYEEYDKYVLVFELADENEVCMTADGAVDVRIVNDDDVIVYDGVHTFAQSDFAEWTYDGTIDKFLASIYIDVDEIEQGSTEKGKIYFTVYGTDYYFDESILTIRDLPVKPISIELPSLPMTIDDYRFYDEVQTKLRIDDITYERVYEDSLYVYFTGEKIYDIDGNNSDTLCSFEWKLYDVEGYLIDKGTFYSDGICVGDKFKNEKIFISGGINAGEQYRLVILNGNM